MEEKSRLFNILLCHITLEKKEGKKKKNRSSRCGAKRSMASLKHQRHNFNPHPEQWVKRSSVTAIVV